ncbi:EamA family transporter [Clostridium sp. chh4-2]|uniref:DMT family transporter n=1 Tax=Clostridium sp. chh4-2 TaxID=2067550 RepID=UPI000CCF6FAC|nr:EamA family transporter [Clostridium sp. chh4-2]PNV61361.1 EamA family transporter [Clostridium sp. chh4-2]
MKKAAPLFILIAGSLWGCMGILVRSLNKIGLESMEVVAVRAFVTFLCMAAGLMVIDRKAFRVHLKDIWCFLGTGICSIVFFNYCYFKTISLTSLSTAAILLYTAPSIVMVLSAVLFKERFTGKKAAALVITFVGCVLVTGGTGGAEGMSAAGILTGLGAGVGYALYSIFGRYAIMRGYSSLTITLWTFGSASIGVLPFISVPGIMGCFKGNPGEIGNALFWIFVTTVAPYILYTLGLSHMETGMASVISSIEPVVATFVGVILYEECLQLSGGIGVVLVIGAIVLINTKQKKKGWYDE